MNQPALANEIRALRVAAGQTVREAAEGSGYSYQYLNAIENNSEGANPTIDALDTIVRHLGGELAVHAAPAGRGKHLTDALSRLTPEQAARAIRFAELAQEASVDLLDGVLLGLEARTRR